MSKCGQSHLRRCMLVAMTRVQNARLGSIQWDRRMSYGELIATARSHLRLALTDAGTSIPLLVARVLANSLVSTIDDLFLKDER